MWNEINDTDDIGKLMDEYSGFHDSCIVSVNYTSGMYVNERNAVVGSDLSGKKLSLILNSPWGKPIELFFEGVWKFSVTAWNERLFGDIYSAHLDFHTDLLGRTRDDRLIVWADDDGFSPKDYTEEQVISRSGRNVTYVIAEKLKWRYI
ncbi:MAG: hypothetical protein ACI4J5_07300 [Oscillospiraceae bacterium]